MTESQDHFLPSADNARRARAAIQARLHESLTHIFDQCRGHVDLDSSRVDTLIQRTTTGERLPPALFGQYFRLIEAIESGLLEQVQQRIDRVLAYASATEAPSIRVRPLNRYEFTAEEEADLRREFVSESLHDEQLSHLDDQEPPAIVAQLDRALATLRTHAPQTYSEIDIIICELVPALGNPFEGMNFDGCSSLERWGTILINAKLPRTDMQLSEVVTHESAHSALFAMAPVNFHVENDAEEKYKSPLRVDKRPMNGIYHSAFVLARMCYAMNEITASETAADALKDEAQQLANTSAKLFADGYEILEQHAQYTPEGRSIMQHAADYMAA